MRSPIVAYHFCQMKLFLLLQETLTPYGAIVYRDMEGSADVEFGATLHARALGKALEQGKLSLMDGGL